MSIISQAVILQSAIFLIYKTYDLKWLLSYIFMQRYVISSESDPNCKLPGGTESELGDHINFHK